jgi:hypothetical protein
MSRGKPSVARAKDAAAHEEGEVKQGPHVIGKTMEAAQGI